MQLREYVDFTGRRIVAEGGAYIADIATGQSVTGQCTGYIREGATKGGTEPDATDMCISVLDFLLDFCTCRHNIEMVPAAA